jgi:hypothetical protein
MDGAKSFCLSPKKSSPLFKEPLPGAKKSASVLKISLPGAKKSSPGFKKSLPKPKKSLLQIQDPFFRARVSFFRDRE